VLLHRYRFRLRTLGPVRFPAFPGPALRGALGEHPEVHSALFRPPATLPQKRFADPPRPFVLRPSFGAGAYGPDSLLELDVSLAGSAGAHFPALLRAMARAGEQGVCAHRNQSPRDGRFHVERVDAVAPGGCTSVVTPGGWVRPASLPWRFPDDFAAPPTHAEAGLTLRFRTPTLVRRGDHPRGSLEFRDLVEDMIRRVSLLSHAYGEGPVYRRHEELAMTDSAAEVGIEDAAVRWVDVPRFSRSQGRAMTFGGWMGWIRYAADPTPWLPLLRVAELHVGKHATFGFGAIELS
jgi:hypothetical protein